MARDFDIEEVIDKMRELRDKRDLELLDKQLENVNLDTDYQRKLTQDKALDVKYIGEINIDGKPKKIFKMLEQKEYKDGNLVEVERYYTEDGEFLGGNNLSDGYKEIMLSENCKERDKILEQLEQIENEEILDLNEIEQDRIEEIAKALGIEKEEIEKLAVMKDKEAKEKGKLGEEEKIEEEQQEESGKEKISKKQLDRISSKAEIKANQKITDKETIETMLGVENENYTEINIVYSDKLKDNSNSTKFSFVGIKIDENGNEVAEKIDTLEQDYGKNPTKGIKEVNRDGTEVTEGQVSSLYSIKGKDEDQLAVNIGTAGVVEAKFVRTPKENNGEAISIPIETHSVKPTTREVRELMNDQKNPRVKEEIQKAEEHQEEDCNPSIENINDNEYDDTHVHNLSGEEIENLVEELKKNPEIDRAFTSKEIEERLRKNMENIAPDEIKEFKEKLKAQTEEEMEQDAAHIKTRE